MRSLLNKIHDLRSAVHRQNELSQSIIDGLSHAFKPCFVAEFLLKLDQKRTAEKHINGIYPLSYWDAHHALKLEEDRRRALREVYAYDLEDRAEEPPELGFNEQDELDFLI